MIQIGFAVEARVSDSIATFSVGWGLATYANRPWYQNLFGLVRQGAVGVRRYGIVALGFFVTAQFVDIHAARAAMAVENVSTRKNISRGPLPQR